MVDAAIFALVHISFLLNISMIIMIALKTHRSQVRTAFLIMLGIMIPWNIGTLLELDYRIAAGVTCIIFIDICYIGICLVPIAILYLGKVVLDPSWQPRRRHALFLIVPFVSIVMVFTNSLHHLFFVNISLYSSEAVYGIYYYFHSLYSYGCITIGIVLLFIASLRNSRIFSIQSLLVITGVIITSIPNALYSFGVGNLPFSISTIAFTVSLLCCAVAFLKYRFITALPITLRQVVDLISDGYLVVDRQFCILVYNRALLRLFPRSANLMLGTDLRSFIEQNFLDLSYNHFLELPARSVAQGETAVTEALVRGDSYVSVEVTPVKNRNMHIGYIILFKDITQTKLIIESTEISSRAKSNFLSHMSHEIRTPLNAIIGMINIGKNTDDIDKKNYCLERADNASKHLLNIINDILDMSKIEADKFELSYSEFDFEKMLTNITNMANISAEKKRQNFIVNLDENVPAYIKSDELRLSQVITNLLTNAIKFTPENGTIILNINKIEENANDVVLRVEVVDTGIGISKEQQRRLFTSFSQADADITRKFGGTGLGLIISKRIVELMGGKIWIESELGEGAKFIFEIKTTKLAEKPHTRLSPNIRVKDLKILAVDDSAETRDYFIRFMNTLKLFCDVASNGEEALEMIKNAKDNPYNIFFIDWHMPYMDGIELSKRIKKINGDNSIIIMISEADWNTIRKDAASAGIKHFISKPLLPSALINTINLCIDTELYESSNLAQHNAPKLLYNFDEHTLLIAEDVEINREIMNAILKETDVSIDYAENGKLAVSMFREHPEKYSLILMDVNMPEMDGYEATRLIRSLHIERAKYIPIIAMTANVFKEDIEKCLESGMNDHIGKPIDANALFELLNKYLMYPKIS